MIRAIVFDLYDTLIYRDEAKSAAVRTEIAALMGVSPSDLAVLWRRYRDQRMLGVIPTLEEHLLVMARELGVELADDLLVRLARIEREGLREAVRLYPNAVPVLEELRRQGFRLGLLSNASDVAEEPIVTLGLSSLFDAIVLSHKVGILKPDPRIYALAAEQLGVLPVECAFVADGGFGELDAAHAVGMLAIKVEQDWQSTDYGSSNYCDLRLAGLAEVLPLARGWRSEAREH
jgi:putative hydrolase of the HAD superfamily